jgi:hypothetical protein
MPEFRSKSAYAQLRAIGRPVMFKKKAIGGYPYNRTHPNVPKILLSQCLDETQVVIVGLIIKLNSVSN